jgi:hypothetical protein
MLGVGFTGVTVWEVGDPQPCQVGTEQSRHMQVHTCVQTITNSVMQVSAMREKEQRASLEPWAGKPAL